MLTKILLVAVTIGSLWADEKLVPAGVAVIPEGSHVYLRIGPDTLPIGYADSGRVLLAKRKDSARLLTHGNRLVISELAIRRAQAALPVTGETWNGWRHGTATVSLAFRDGMGNPDSIQANLRTEDIEEVFLRIPIPHRTVRKDRGGGGLTLFASALTGGVMGIYYSRQIGGLGRSSSGNRVLDSGLLGMLIGTLFGIPIALLEG
ncbi:MAG: hypothetical protein JF616_17010 [Fibrobacteres bacterium]|nr:hypothetical protein [Fibrobacterota bacterium]